MVLQFLVAALIGYVITLRWSIVLMVIYTLYILLGFSADPQFAAKIWRIDFLIFQGIGLFVGAFIRKSRDKKRIDRVSTVDTTKVDNKAEETEKNPETASAEPVSESELTSEPEDEEDAFLV